MDVVGGRAGVTAQQLSSVFAHSAKLHVVVLLLAGGLLLLLLLVFGLPLDALLLLEAQIWFRAFVSFKCIQPTACNTKQDFVLLFVVIRLLFFFIDKIRLFFYSVFL